MDYQEAKRQTERREGCECTVLTRTPSLINGGGCYNGLFKELTESSIVIETTQGVKKIALDQIYKLNFEI